jgi:hypothetical protein
MAAIAACGTAIGWPGTARAGENMPVGPRHRHVEVEQPVGKLEHEAMERIQERLLPAARS